jgi:hypothetical protein
MSSRLLWTFLEARIATMLLKFPIHLRKRLYASVSSFGDSGSIAPYLVFDRHAKVLQKDRAASSKELSRQVDYLRNEVVDRMLERFLVGDPHDTNMSK